MGHLKELEHKAIVNPAVGKQTHAYPCQNWKSSLFFKGLQVADAPVHSGTPPVWTNPFQITFSQTYPTVSTMENQRPIKQAVVDLHALYFWVIDGRLL